MFAALKKIIRRTLTFCTFHFLNLPVFSAYRTFLWSTWADSNKGSKLDARLLIFTCIIGWADIMLSLILT